MTERVCPICQLMICPGQHVAWVDECEHRPGEIHQLEPETVLYHRACLERSVRSGRKA